MFKAEYFELDEGERGLIDWQFKSLDDRGFDKLLWDAIENADMSSLRKLEKGFPLHVNAYRRFIGEDGYWQELRNKAYEPG